MALARLVPCVDVVLLRLGCAGSVSLVWSRSDPLCCSDSAEEQCCGISVVSYIESTEWSVVCRMLMPEATSHLHAVQFTDGYAI